MARRKAAALDVPANEDEARRLLEEYVAIERWMLDHKLEAQIKIDRLKAGTADLLAAAATGNMARFAALKAWWEAGGKEIAGRSRSAELAGATLGLRLAPHAVKLKRGIKASAIVTWLRSLRWNRAKDFLRVKVELDKQAIIKAVTAEPQIKARFADQGLTVERVDEFFIDTGLDEEAIRKEVAANLDAEPY